MTVNYLQALNNCLPEFKDEIDQIFASEGCKRNNDIMNVDTKIKPNFIDEEFQMFNDNFFSDKFWPAILNDYQDPERPRFQKFLKETEQSSIQYKHRYCVRSLRNKYSKRLTSHTSNEQL